MLCWKLYLLEMIVFIITLHLFIIVYKSWPVVGHDLYSGIGGDELWTTMKRLSFCARHLLKIYKYWIKITGLVGYWLQVTRAVGLWFFWFPWQIVCDTHSHTHTHTHTHVHLRSLSHTRAHAHTHTCTYAHARTHANPHAHTHASFTFKLRSCKRTLSALKASL